MVKCHRCDGQGTLPELLHVQNGVCFVCGGTGRLATTEELVQTELEQHCEMVQSWLESVVEHHNITTNQLMYVYLPKKLGNRASKLVTHRDKLELEFTTELGRQAVITVFNATDNIQCLPK